MSNYKYDPALDDYVEIDPYEQRYEEDKYYRGMEQHYRAEEEQEIVITEKEKQKIAKYFERQKNN